MSYEQFFLLFGKKDQVFVRKTNPKGATDFCAYLFKVFEHSYGYAPRTFHKHSSKISSRRNAHNS